MPLTLPHHTCLGTTGQWRAQHQHRSNREQASSAQIWLRSPFTVDVRAGTCCIPTHPYFAQFIA